MGRGRSKAGTSITFSTTIPQNAQSQQQQQQQNQSQNGSTDGDRGQFANLDYATFLKQDEATRFKTIQDIVSAKDVVVPSYLDNSDATKVVFALGMNNKPDVVDDATLDGMSGRELFRGLYDAPNISAVDIAKQLRDADYTQFSGSGGSVHGRGIYFGTDFGIAKTYSTWGGSTPTAIRAKIKSTAKIVQKSTLKTQMASKGFFVQGAYHEDQMALYAISQGISGWYNSNYTIMVDRGALTMSKDIVNTQGASDWKSAKRRKQ